MKKLIALFFILSGLVLIHWPSMALGTIFIFDAPIRSVSDGMLRCLTAASVLIYPGVWIASLAIAIDSRRKSRRKPVFVGSLLTPFLWIGVAASLLWFWDHSNGGAQQDSINELNRLADENGSPFRFETRKASYGGSESGWYMIDLPSGQSRAGSIVKKTILSRIGRNETILGRVPSHLDDIKLLKDGREIWLFKWRYLTVAYVVRIYPESRNGRDFELGSPIARVDLGSKDNS
jgi:hypothetical protein